MFDETGDIAKSQGWTALVLDTNGNGKRDEYTEPGKPLDPAKDKRIGATVLRRDAEPGRRLDLGHAARQPRRGRAHRSGPRTRTTALAEVYNVPLPGFGARGADIDKQGRRLGVARRAATWAASIAASARARSTARRRPATTAPRAGRSTSIPARASRASARTAPSRATTRGSISTTRSGSATTCRCRPAT